MARTTPEGLTGPRKPEHNCKPLAINNQLMATCAEHYGQPPVLRNEGIKLK